MGRGLSFLKISLVLGSVARAHAFSLPPKIVEESFSWEKDLRALPQQRARSVERLSQTPILHGGLVWDEKARRLVVLSPDGQGAQSISTAAASLSDAPAAYRPLNTAEAQRLFGRLEARGTEWRFGPGHFQLEEARLDYLDRPRGTRLWSVDLGFRPLGVDFVPSRQMLLAWGAYPPRLVLIPSDLRRLYRIAWSPDSEPLRFFACDRYQQVLVENLRNGLVRLFFFQGEKPVSYTIFDFTPARQSELTAVVAPSCNEFYFAGSFGLSRVRY